MSGIVDQNHQALFYLGLLLDIVHLDCYAFPEIGPPHISKEGYASTSSQPSKLPIMMASYVHTEDNLISYFKQC